MKSILILAGVFLFSLFVSNVEARKDPGEYWAGVTEVPELIHNLVDTSKVTCVSNTKTDDCHTSTMLTNSEAFESRPNISGDKFTKEFEPRPNISAYSDDAKPKEDKFTKEFEPRPNISAYSDKSKLEGENFTKDFEPRPNISAYSDDAKPEHETFTKDFASRPNISIYHE